VFHCVSSGLSSKLSSNLIQSDGFFSYRELHILSPVPLFFKCQVCQPQRHTRGTIFISASSLFKVPLFAIFSIILLKFASVCNPPALRSASATFSFVNLSLLAILFLYDDFIDLKKSRCSHSINLFKLL
jgi:hypothetical protein